MFSGMEFLYGKDGITVGQSFEIIAKGLNRNWIQNRYDPESHQGLDPMEQARGWNMPMFDDKMLQALKDSVR